MTRSFHRSVRLLALAPMLCLPLTPLLAQEEASDKNAKKEAPQVYDPKVDAKAQVARAVERARRDGKRVLLVFGGNWCGWCIKLHELFKSDREIAKLLGYEYEVVPVDVGRFDKHLDLVASYGADLKKHGVPFLTVLAADGKPLANQDTGSLEDGPRHDPAKVRAFLEKWKAEPLDAQAVLKEALARARAEEKRLLVHLGAPW